MNLSKVESSEQKPTESKRMHSRKEDYYKNGGVSTLFNYENQLNEVEGRFHGKSRRFCHQFSLDSSSEKKVKRSFSMA